MILEIPDRSRELNKLERKGVKIKEVNSLSIIYSSLNSFILGLDLVCASDRFTPASEGIKKNFSFTIAKRGTSD
ncbi:MAG: hypothetical protein JKY54_16425 [Flavobacteriales bacterium]|nr:hypothetical protein [Flavobacteriales bacterium]